MSERSALIVNPRSHRVATKGSVLEQVAARHAQFPLIRFEEVHQLSSDIDACLDAGANTLFVEGGDGTLVAVLTACLERRGQGKELPQIAVLPGGSTNLAYDILGFQGANPSSVEQHLNQNLPAGRDRGIRRHRALIIETSENATPLVGFLLSTGSLARAMLYTQQNLHDAQRGKLAIARAVLQFGLFPKETKLSDGEPVIHASRFLELSDPSGTDASDHAFSVFSTFEHLSLGLNPFWNRDEAPIGYTRAAWPIPRLRAGVAKLIMGRSGQSLEKHGLSSRGCEELTFTCDGPLVLDGEVLPLPSDRQFKVTASPELEFIQ